MNFALSGRLFVVIGILAVYGGRGQMVVGLAGLFSIGLGMILGVLSLFGVGRPAGQTYKAPWVSLFLGCMIFLLVGLGVISAMLRGTAQGNAAAAGPFIDPVNGFRLDDPGQSWTILSKKVLRKINVEAAAGATGGPTLGGFVFVENPDPDFRIAGREHLVGKQLAHAIETDDKRIVFIRPDEVDGQRAVRCQVVGKTNGLGLRYEVVALIANGRLYRLTAIGPSDQTADDGLAFRPFMDAFHVLATGPQASAPIKTQVAPRPAADNLALARNGFVTRLRVRGPAPQEYRNDKPPAGVERVEYTSGKLKLKGWLSVDAGEGTKRPAVVYLHGGWAFGAGDWEDAEPFAKAGYVLFMPMLRGENGNPGTYESFLGEVDDVIAAGRFVSELPNVDAANVFVAGHSVGGVLTCLASMVPSPYKAAAALDGSVDMETWAAHSPDAHVPYDRNDQREVRVRNPMAFAASIRCPLRLYSGTATRGVNARLANRAKQAGKDCELVLVRGDHLAMVTPAVQQAIAWFRQLAVE